MRNQKSTDVNWVDETGREIPYSRTTKAERLQEKVTSKIVKEALVINGDLNAFKTALKKACDEVFETFMKDKEIDYTGKGNFTFHNFDRSIKIERNINERIEFDEMGITACKAKLMEYIDVNITSSDDALKSMIMDAFSNTKGKLDVKKVMSLLRYEAKIKAGLYQEAMKLLKASIRVVDSKTYYKIYLRNEGGEYDVVELNFSNI